ncbi:MAG: hypothetical protein HOV68_06010 [Streptomycetaceae bacterium]|nr:hypothetical protein [Streptomycetaceae bacterium]
MPSFVGQGLQTAQDGAQEAGYFNLASSDSLGRGRMQILDRDWQVCFQDPAPGHASTDTKVTFGVVKIEENCPPAPISSDVPSASNNNPTPNVIGKSANVARAAFPSNASVRSQDVSGSGRAVLVESNWQVCTQTPAGGSPYNGQPVLLGVVKFGESCP